MESAVKIESADVGEDVGSQDEASTVEHKLESTTGVKQEMDFGPIKRQNQIHSSSSLNMTSAVKIELSHIGEGVGSQDAASTVEHKLKVTTGVKREMDIESIERQKPIQHSSSLDMASAVKIEPPDVREDVSTQDATSAIKSKPEPYIDLKKEMDIGFIVQQKPIHDSNSLDMASVLKIESTKFGEDIDSQDATSTIERKLEVTMDVKQEMNIRSIVQQKPIHNSSSLDMTSAVKIEPPDVEEDDGSQDAANTNCKSKVEATTDEQETDFWLTILEKPIHDSSSLNIASALKSQPSDVREDVTSQDAASAVEHKLESTTGVKQEMDCEPTAWQKPIQCSNPLDMTSAVKVELSDVGEGVHLTRRSCKPIEDSHAQSCPLEELQLDNVIRRQTNESSTPTTSMTINPSPPHDSQRRSKGRGKIYCCGICDKTFTKKQYLQKHMYIHIEQKSYACDVCSKCFIVKSDLAKHKLIHIGQTPHCCNICNKIFTKKFNLTSHMIVHSGQKSHSCNTCGKNFTKKSSLIRHMLVHLKQNPHPCNICGTSFSEKSKVISHMLVHAGQKPHCCNICSKSFSYKSNLKKHMVIHSGEKPHCCNICSKSFSDKGNLRKHTFVHSGQKPHSCNMCSKSFSQKSNLTTHMLVHSGYKPHSCNICSKTFSQLGSLTHHLLIHTGQKQHRCNICGKSFRQKGNLTTHMLIHSGST